MRQKALIIWIFMFFFGMSGLVVQFIAADVFGITIKNFEGVPLQSNILSIIDLDDINLRTTNIINANFTENTTAFNRVENPEISSAFVAWEVIQLITGTYIFQLLILFGVDTIMVTGMVIVYVVLLAYFIWTAVRGQ